MKQKVSFLDFSLTTFDRIPVATLFHHSHYQNTASPINTRITEWLTPFLAQSLAHSLAAVITLAGQPVACTLHDTTSRAKRGPVSYFKDALICGLRKSKEGGGGGHSAARLRLLRSCHHMSEEAWCGQSRFELAGHRSSLVSPGEGR